MQPLAFNIYNYSFGFILTYLYARHVTLGISYYYVSLILNSVWYYRSYYGLIYHLNGIIRIEGAENVMGPVWKTDDFLPEG